MLPSSSSSLTSISSDQNSLLKSLIAFSNEVGVFGVPNLLGAKKPLWLHLNLDSWAQYQEDYQNSATINFLPHMFKWRKVTIVVLSI